MKKVVFVRSLKDLLEFRVDILFRQTCAQGGVIQFKSRTTQYLWEKSETVRPVSPENNSGGSRQSGYPQHGVSTPNKRLHFVSDQFGGFLGFLN